jgi:sigma-E factor negative regulatory protein RseA
MNTINTMKPSMQTKELLSALADGQLGGEDFAAALQACRDDESAQSALASWNTYHLIGEVLRSPAPMVQGTDLAFVSQLNQRLAQEPPIRVTPRSFGLESVAPIKETALSGLTHHRGPASNESMFRWKLVAGLASLAAVSAIAWNASGLLAPDAAPQLAQASEPRQVVVISPQGPVVRDARIEELLAAHKQLAGTSVLQEPPGFLRQATFETSPSAKR